MGVGSRTKAWRFTDINKDYAVCLRFFLVTRVPVLPIKIIVLLYIPREVGGTYTYK